MLEDIIYIILGIGMIVLGLLFLIIWKLIKSDYSIIKATLMDRCYGGHSASHKSQCYCTIVYFINNKEYRKQIIVKRESPLAYRRYRKRI